MPFPIFNGSLEDKATAPTAQSSEAGFILEALKYTLQIAFEHAVFLNRFEIDEQEPRSRCEALTEQLLDAANNLPSNSVSEAEETATKAVIISIICEVSKRVRVTIQ
jgi:hypothetical protein